MENNKYSVVSKYAGLGVQWMVTLAVAVWGGLKVDHLIGWKIPILTIVFPLLALGFLFWQLIKSIKQDK